mgnify:FL=1
MKKNMKSSSILLGGLFSAGGGLQLYPDGTGLCVLRQSVHRYGRTWAYLSRSGSSQRNDSAQPRHAYLRVGCLLRILLCRYYYQRIFTYSRQRYGLCRLRGCVADAHCRAAGLPLYGLEEPADGVRLCLFPRE